MKFGKEGHNLRVKISTMEKFTQKSMSGRSRYNTITKYLRGEIVEFILYYLKFKQSFVSSDVVNIFNPESN